MNNFSTGPADCCPPPKLTSNFGGSPPQSSPVDDELTLSPTDFLAVVNQTLEYAYSSVCIVGEVASFKVNQGKWVFFDIKDEESSVSCFMTLWSLRQPLEDGMKVIVRGVPKVTKWGKFSFTVTQVAPVGEGSLKKAYEMLKKKLTAEGLFDVSRKRSLPADLAKLGVISSTQAAGYADFIKIANARWGGMKIMVAHTQVQGLDAPDQIIRALKYFNERAEVDAIVILRGGGSADDLSCFNDEQLVREIAASRIPVVTGIGHEVDESLADLVADIRASTPSNAAELLTRDRKEELTKVKQAVGRIEQTILHEVVQAKRRSIEKMAECKNGMLNAAQRLESKLAHCTKLLEVLNPEKVLKQGYAILAGNVSPGNVVKITTFKKEAEAKIIKVKERN